MFFIILSVQLNLVILVFVFLVVLLFLLATFGSISLCLSCLSAFQFSKNCIISGMKQIVTLSDWVWSLELLLLITYVDCTHTYMIIYVENLRFLRFRETEKKLSTLKRKNKVHNISKKESGLWHCNLKASRCLVTTSHVWSRDNDVFETPRKNNLMRLWGSPKSRVSTLYTRSQKPPASSSSCRTIRSRLLSSGRWLLWFFHVNIFKEKGSTIHWLYCLFRALECDHWACFLISVQNLNLNMLTL